MPVMLATVWMVSCAPEAREGSLGSLSAERGELVEEWVLTGELAAEAAVELVAPDVPVRPLEIRWIAEDGLEVRRGDRLVEFDNSSLVADLEDRRTRVEEAVNQLAQAQAEAAVALAEAQLQLASAEATQQKAVLEAQVPRDLVPALEYGDKQLALRRAELELEKARELVKAKNAKGEAEVQIAAVVESKARLALERSLRGIELLSITAPRAGIFLPETNFRESRPWQEGDSLWPGQKVARLPDLGSLLVRAQLPDVDGAAVKVGQEATVTLDAFPDRRFSGRVKEVEGVAQSQGSHSSRRFFGVTVEIEGLDPAWMRPGMSSQVVLRRSSCEDCLLIPRQSLGFDEAGKSRARLRNGGWAPVTLGPCSDLVCAVEEGLEEGTPLAPAGYAEAEV